MSGAKVQSELVYTKGFKARAPNMKVINFWNDGADEADELRSRSDSTRARCWSRR